MRKVVQGFTLIEFITVVILIGIVSVTLFSRIDNIKTTNIRAGRDDLIAALFFAQQTAMARNNIQLVLTANSVSVTENGTPIKVHAQGYPLVFPTGVTTTPITLSYDKLGRTTATTISLSATGDLSASIQLEASGYAH